MSAPVAQFRMPDLGEGLTEAEIVRWLVAAGDRVRVDQPVVEVETAKAVVEVPTPFAGTVTAVHAAAGTVRVGEPLLSVAVGEEAEVVAAGAGSAPGAEARAGSGSVLVGYGTGAATGPRRRHRPRTRRAPARTAGSVGSAAPAVESRTAEAPARTRVVSPLVRRLAQEWGVDLRTVRGSGHGGLILRRDVERAAAAQAGAAAALPGRTEWATDPGPATAPGPRTVPAPGPRTAPASGPEAGGERRAALSGLGKAAAAAFTRSRREIPEATIWVDVDATPLVALRERTEPGLLAYLARFTVAALREFPVFNSRYDAERQEIVHLDRINLGIAVQGARGLVVPAVVGAETLTTTELGAGIRRVVAAARAGTSTPAELTAGTFTLNDYGVFDVDGGAPILNPPQVAMLGVGRIIDRPWVVEGAVVVRKVAQLSFVFDHRVCDGETASRFLRRVADAVENPAAALAHL